MQKAGDRRKCRSRRFGFYEFFAGGGMVRAGLGTSWNCLFANDIDARKAACYAANWGAGELNVGDVAAVSTSMLPAEPHLVWASFPCQDLSLAGDQAGLAGARSGTFWSFWGLILGLRKENRHPPVIALENVCGALTSHGGADFAAIGSAVVSAGYRFGALVIDAAAFLPQSRPRLFIVAHRKDLPAPQEATSGDLPANWTSAALERAYLELPSRVRGSWVWWHLPKAAPRRSTFADLVDRSHSSARWHSEEETRRLLSMMSERHAEKLRKAISLGRPVVGTVYKRTRPDASGNRVQRAEVRFDEVAGCLRTPVGGSSRQTVLFVEGAQIRSRLLLPREAARLMGLPESYELPSNYNEAYHVAGDGVAVPVVRHLARHLIEPLIATAMRRGRSAA